MDTIDRTILNCLQFNFPLTTRPFLSIARVAEIPEAQVLARITELKAHGVIRQISAIFDSSKIGYHSVLAAFKVPPERLDQTVAFLNGHPGISHNYLREGAYNLWFTVTVLRSRDLKKEVACLAKETAVRDWLYLPTLRQFKISFQLDMKETAGSEPRQTATVRHDLPKTFSINEVFVRELQKDLQLTARPYRHAASALRCTEGEVVALLRDYIEAGAVRRVASVLRPIHAGFPANILVAWRPDDKAVENLGKTAALLREVSHCYQRPTTPKWPYSVYTMIHGKSLTECRKAIKTIVERTGVTNFCELKTLKEFKKIRVEYYPE